MRATAVSTVKTGIISIVLIRLAAAPVAALSSLDVTWRSAGSPKLPVGTTGVQIADITLTVDIGANTVSGVFWSVGYDATELTAIGAREGDNSTLTTNLPSMGNEFAPIAPGADITTVGIVTGFDQGTLGTGLVAGNTRTIGSVKFNVTNVIADGQGDVQVVIQQTGIDGIGDSSGTRCIGALSRNDCPYSFGAALVPEPTTATLVVLGLGMGAFYNRRR